LSILSNRYAQEVSLAFDGKKLTPACIGESGNGQGFPAHGIVEKLRTEVDIGEESWLENPSPIPFG